MKNLDIIIPVKDEVETLEELVKRISSAFKDSGIKYQNIFIDDHSTDGTFQKLNQLKKNYPITIVKKHGKPGKAFSILEGSQIATSSYIAVIDADLQYPPESLIDLIKETELSGLVVGKRKYNGSKKFRHLISRSAKLFLGKFLFKFKYDVLSGVKVFKKDILEQIKVEDITPSSLDVPLLDTALELGYSISEVEIEFQDRKNKNHNNNRLKNAIEITKSAINYRLKNKAPLIISPSKGLRMTGAGFNYKRNRYITHTTLSHNHSALQTTSKPQRYFISLIIGILSLGILFNAYITAITVVGILSFVYFVDVFFNLYLILKSLHQPPEIKISDSELKKLKGSELPVYTILCPLYKEAHVLPAFLDSIDAIDWPHKKLEVMLLLEADDTETIAIAESMKLPNYVKIVVVPDSKPKTKPKACNYGLSMARGEFLVIYDAEDIPEPSQLKKVYAAFKKLPAEIKCIQAKLNYYNPHQNLLTKFFTAEYSLWFDVILTGLQTIQTSIPLGGTSNHFRTEELLELQGWDPFNVTEDCDLGIRLFNHGGKTAVIDSITLEEANSNWRNWIRQRSRWIKGYMQTYLLHMRNPLKLLQEQGIHAVIFQLTVGGKIAFLLINPIMWLLTISYFLLYQFVGPTIESLYPASIFYMAVTSLVFGNFLFVYYYMIGLAKREHWNLIKYVFLVPIYWLVGSYAALVALYQLIVKPHYWEKTIHGLHLNNENRAEIKKIKKIKVASIRGRHIQRIADFTRSELFGSGILIVSSLFGNILNYLYNAYLGRSLDLNDFGTISLIGSFLYLSSVPFSAVGRSVTHRTAYLFGKYKFSVKDFWEHLRKHSFKVSMVVALIWLALTPLLKNYFHTDDIIPFVIFTPVWMIGILASIDGGFLGGNLRFKAIAFLSLAEAFAKLFFSILFVVLGVHEYVYAAVPLSMFVAFLLQWLIVKNIKTQKIPKEDLSKALRFPKRFFATSILTTLTSISYLSLDLLLAKHYLSPQEAGSYSYLTLAGKMVFFMGGLVSQFLTPMVSRDLGAGKKDNRLFIKILSIVAGINLLTFTVFGILGKFTVPLLWGEKAAGISEYLPIYTFAMVCYSLSSLIISYRQIRGQYAFPIAGFLLGLLQVGGMMIWHENIGQLSIVIAASGLTSFIAIGLMHVFYGQLVTIWHNFLDFLGIFGKLPEREALAEGKLRILIFNWRDLKHVWSGGAEVYIHELSRRWVKDGHEVTVFCGNDSKSKRHEKIDGVQIIRRGGFFTVYFWAFMYYRCRLRGLYDVIIDSENGLPFFTPIYAKEKIFILIHHVHQEVFRKSLIPPFSWLAQFMEKRLMPIVYRKTEVITVSPSSKKEIIKHKLTKKVPQIVYNGVNLDICVPGKKAKIPTVLYLGRLTTAKSLKVLINATKQIIDKVPTAQIIIAGDGPDKKRLMKKVKTLGLEKTVTFMGKVSEKEKVELYQRAWVFVNPSLMEGWGITTIEANACGTPVVASDVAGLRDAVNSPNSGVLVEYGDASEFAKNIIKILNNKKLRDKMSQAAIEWAKKFDWDESASNGLKALQKE
ncbi:glycosyltransferase [Candidatus Woesebacteria bacterium]|nr:glycosyltransferase [Candidatus Woesebacteria bacterium]